MPNYYEQVASFQNAAVEDKDRFQKLPFYLVKNEIKTFPRWNIFDQLYGDISWEPNMGNVMRAVTPQASPVANSFAFPVNIDQVPNKNVYQVTESSEDARVKAQRFESSQFSFVPYFTSFWRDHLQYANKDIARQIQVYNNQFIRTGLWSKSNYVYLAGTGLISGAPTSDINTTGDAAGSKTTAWLAAQIPNIKNNLSLRTIYRAQLAHREDLAAPPFEGVKNMPEDNEGLKGRYCIVGSTEAWDAFPFDPDTNLLKSINLDLLFKDFNGLLFGKVVYKYDPFPLRFKADGTFVAPQVIQDLGKAGNAQQGTGGIKAIPNPDYTNPNVAAYEIAWMLGQDACKTIKVGPPPKEFAAQSMSQKKFYSLKWNGEIQLTDQVLVTYADGSVDLNVYGTQLKFISQTTFGYLVGEPRFAFPILFRRKRPEELP